MRPARLLLPALSALLLAILAPNASALQVQWMRGGNRSRNARAL